MFYNCLSLILFNTSLNPSYVLNKNAATTSISTKSPSLSQSPLRRTSVSFRNSHQKCLYLYEKNQAYRDVHGYVHLENRRCWMASNKIRLYYFDISVFCFLTILKYDLRLNSTTDNATSQSVVLCL